MNEHANGWLPELVLTIKGDPIHVAPNNTGYLMIKLFHSELAFETPPWPYAITDNRNNPIPFEKISARDLADSHRRGICSAAAAYFSLAYELWAREEVAASSSETVETQPETQLQQAKVEPPKTASKRTPKAANDASAPPADINEAVVKKGLIDTCVDLIQAKLDSMNQISWIADKATKWDLDASGSKLAQMTVDQLQSCIDELRAKPDLQK